MAVRLTLLAAPLLGVTLVLLALLPPSSHVASSALVAPTTATSQDTNTPRSLPCTKGEVVRGKRSTKGANTGCMMTTNKGNTPEEVSAAHMSKRAVIEGPEAPLSADKRAPSSSGFFGMRGKKGGDGEEEMERGIQRAPSEFFGMEDQPVGLMDLDLETADKRAPSSSGFFGMRGKKLPMAGYAPWYRDPKRARMGFFGTRGKKSDGEKRGPSMGFFGSRGKKSDAVEDVVYGWSPLELEEGAAAEDKRAVQHMGFFGMRGKKGSEGTEEMGNHDKRAAQMGFFGMRGKKAFGEDDYDEAYGDAGSKRAPMGFFGMRGKKNGYWSEGGDKRAPMGFFGMRGKKDGEMPSMSYEYPEEEKRAQQMGFFGMRGKRAEEFVPSGDGIYEEESKRGLAGAAVAAWPTATRRAPYTLDSLLAYLAGRDASRVDADRLGAGWRPVRKRFRGNKKAPMGFIGMRGKKVPTESLSKEVWPPSQTNAVGSEEMDSTIPEGDDELQNQLDSGNSH